MNVTARQRGGVLVEIMIPLFAVLVAMLASDILILLYGQSPREVYAVMLEGTLGNPYGLGQVVFKATPLIFTGLAVAFAFHAGLFNIGAEGQLYAGALAIGVAGTYLPASLPAMIAVPIVLVAGVAAGAFAGFVPGWLKAKTGAHEVINTIMLNFIVVALANYLLGRFFVVPETLHTPEIAASARLARLSAFLPGLKGSAANLSFFAALAACAAVHVLFFRTRLGYELRAVGANPAAAEAAGIPVGRRVILAMTISGALAGLVGANFVCGYKYYFEEGFSSGLGFMGIAVALLARNNPLGIIAAALFFGMLSEGGLVINAMVPKELVEILQAVVIIAVVASGATLRGKGSRA